MSLWPGGPTYYDLESAAPRTSVILAGDVVETTQLHKMVRRELTPGCRGHVLSVRGKEALVQFGGKGRPRGWVELFKLKVVEP